MHERILLLHIALVNRGSRFSLLASVSTGCVNFSLSIALE